MPLGMEGLGPDDIVLDGEPAPSPKTGRARPIFGPHLLWPNGCMDQDATLYRGKRRPGDVVLDEVTDPLPQFSANVRCDQTAGWTKLPLGMEVGLSPGDFVFDVSQLSPEKRAHLPPPNFWLMSIVAKRMDGSRCHFVRR